MTARYIFDMETGDPDDVLTLLLLGAHPGVELRAVTITPGSREQVSMVRWLLQAMGLESVRVGAQEWPKNAEKPRCIQGRFYDNFGRAETVEEGDCEPADRVLRECCDESVTLVTGAALHNLGAALQLPGFCLGRWVAQGGFAGEGVVPSELQMDKFRGKAYCNTWNFGGNIKAAERALASREILRKVCVSKNVCHRALYDKALHAAFGEATKAAAAQDADCRRARSLMLLHGAMENQMGKKLHDPLALATAFDESVCRLAEVRVHKSKNGWGSVLCEGSGVWISVDYDDARFREVILGCGLGGKEAPAAPGTRCGTKLGTAALPEQLFSDELGASLARRCQPSC